MLLGRHRKIYTTARPNPGPVGPRDLPGMRVNQELASPRNRCLRGLAFLQNGNVRPYMRIRPLALALWAVWMIYAFGFSTLGVRLWTQLNGTITSSRDTPPIRGPRYSTEYILIGPDGKESSYIAGPTDSSLPRSMPVGTTLRKQRWQIGYERDGRWVSDFGLPFYLGALAIAFGCLVWSSYLWRRKRQ
jgi:hypothetical protein